MYVSEMICTSEQDSWDKGRQKVWQVKVCWLDGSKSKFRGWVWCPLTVLHHLYQQDYLQSSQVKQTNQAINIWQECWNWWNRSLELSWDQANYEMSMTVINLANKKWLHFYQPMYQSFGFTNLKVHGLHGVFCWYMQAKAKFGTMIQATQSA